MVPLLIILGAIAALVAWNEYQNTTGGNMTLDATDITKPIQPQYPSVADRLSQQVRDLLLAAAQKYGVDPNVVMAQAYAESGGNQSAVSSAGAIGVMQLEPETAAGLGVDPHDLAQNIDGGVRYLSQQFQRFGNYTLALAAYNWGPGRIAVDKDPSTWPEETQNYVSRILGWVGVG